MNKLKNQNLFKWGLRNNCTDIHTFITYASSYKKDAHDSIIQNSNKIPTGKNNRYLEHPWLSPHHCKAPKWFDRLLVYNEDYSHCRCTTRALVWLNCQPQHHQTPLKNAHTKLKNIQQ